MGVTATREARLALLRQILQNKGKDVLIVAELGPWKGRDAFLQGIRTAADVGADVAKIQVFKALHFPSQEWEAKLPLEWPRGHLRDEPGGFVYEARAHGLLTCASVFDGPGIIQCAMVGIDILKLAAREQFNEHLDVACEMADLPIFRSVDFGYLHDVNELRPISSFRKTVLLACISQYPTPILDARYAIGALGVGPFSWGWSSHTSAWEDCVQAVQQDARVIEKHLALTPDDPEIGWSLLPEQFAEMVTAIRKVENAR